VKRKNRQKKTGQRGTCQSEEEVGKGRVSSIQLGGWGIGKEKRKKRQRNGHGSSIKEKKDGHLGDPHKRNVGPEIWERRG